MSQEGEFHILTVGWDSDVIENLWDRVIKRSDVRFSHLLHPRFIPGDEQDNLDRPDFHFFRTSSSEEMPAADHGFLASLERVGVPTINNMIMGDRIVSKLRYSEALSYATFLARRMMTMYDELKPSVIIGTFDAIHGSLALAVAREKGFPWFALNFSVLPRGLACFCNQLLPSARVSISSRKSVDSTRLAETSLRKFENREVQAHAYIAPKPLGIYGEIRKIPRRIRSLQRTIQKSRNREFIQFLEDRSGYDAWAAWLHLWRATRARKAISRIQAISEPPESPYVFFGLHFQPESSIDVWAPYFSNQMWVIELLSRSIPPTHKLLVKIHKSDVSNHSRAQLDRMMSFPGVEIVAPFADTHSFIQNADLVVAIQSTVGLEAALFGKPVIMLGDSPVNIFPSASPVGKIQDLPVLIESKLKEAQPVRDEIVRAYASYLAPFQPACHNDWTRIPDMEEIGNYVEIVGNLRSHLSG